LPAIGRLAAAGSIADNFHVLGVARDAQHNDASFRSLALDSMAASGLQPDQVAGFCNNRFHYQALSHGEAANYTELGARIESLERQYGLPAHRTFYLAIPTISLGDTLLGLGRAASEP
jgi:glucose-6-phosphate 1-dehydrogenase